MIFTLIWLEFGNTLNYLHISKIAYSYTLSTSLTQKHYILTHFVASFEPLRGWISRNHYCIVVSMLLQFQSSDQGDDKSDRALPFICIYTSRFPRLTSHLSHKLLMWTKKSCLHVRKHHSERMTSIVTEHQAFYGVSTVPFVNFVI